MHIEFGIALRIFNSGIENLTICSLLNRKPNYMHTKGEFRKTPAGKPLKGSYQKNYLSFDFESEEGESIPGAITRILDKYEQQKVLFIDIADSGGSTEFFIEWKSPGNTGEIFTWDLFEKLAKFKINIALDVYGNV